MHMALQGRRLFELGKHVLAWWADFCARWCLGTRRFWRHIANFQAWPLSPVEPLEKQIHDLLMTPTVPFLPNMSKPDFTINKMFLFWFGKVQVNFFRSPVIIRCNFLQVKENRAGNTLPKQSICRLCVYKWTKLQTQRVAETTYMQRQNYIPQPKLCWSHGNWYFKV